MAKYVPDSKWIASIYPGKLPPITKYHGQDPNPRKPRATVYSLDPVARGKKPFMLEVIDSFENVPNPMKAAESQKSERIGSNMVFDSAPVACEQIVENLIQEWAGGMVGVPVGAQMGIMAIIGTVPTQAELILMTEMQTKFFEYMFQEGERLDRQREWKGIRQPMVDAAIWLGRDRLWSSPSLSTEMVPCPACKKDIPADSIICNVCGIKLRALPPELAALNPPAPQRAA